MKHLQGWVDQRDDFSVVQDVFKGFKPEIEELDDMPFQVPSREVGSRKRRWT